MIKINRCQCLTIDKRLRYFDEAKEQFKNVGLDLTMFLAGDNSFPSMKYDHIDLPLPRNLKGSYPAWKARPNAYNCHLCHKKIIQKAKEDNIEVLLLAEDDVVLNDNFSEILEKASEQLEKHSPNWHMLYLGANHTYMPTKEVDKNLLKLNGSGCLHCCLIRNTVFDAILSLPVEGALDEMVGKNIHKKYDCYGVWPNIAITRAGYSYCEANILDYGPLYLNKGC